MKIDLWGDLPNPAELRSPEEILSEQASLLASKTQGTLRGNVSLSESNRSSYRDPDFDFCYSLEIIAPLLNNFVYEVCSVSHNVGFFPAWVWSPNSEHIKCEDEKTLIDALGIVLRSNQTQQVIAALRKQSTARRKPERVKSPASDDDIPF